MLHYVYDPLCGWCYGAAPLIHVAASLSAITLHAGGMMTGSRRQQMTPALRQFVKSHDERIGQMTGQSFGEAYTNGLLADNSAMFDSAPPIAAILAAEQLAGKGLAMLSALQQSHYQQGRKIAELLTPSHFASSSAGEQTNEQASELMSEQLSVLVIDLANKIGINPISFGVAIANNLHKTVPTHIQETRMLMAQLQLQGFPSLLLSAPGGFKVLELSSWFGKPQAFGEWLLQQLQRGD